MSKVKYEHKYSKSFEYDNDKLMVNSFSQFDFKDDNESIHYYKSYSYTNLNKSCNKLSSVDSVVNNKNNHLEYRPKTTGNKPRSNTSHGCCTTTNDYGCFYSGNKSNLNVKSDLSKKSIYRRYNNNNYIEYNPNKYKCHYDKLTSSEYGLCYKDKDIFNKI